MNSVADVDLKLNSKEWGVLLLLTAINFTHTMDFVMVIPMGPKLIQQLHITAAQVGHIISSYTISAAIFGLIGAGTIDRIDRKKALIISFFGLIAGTLCCAYASSYFQLLLARAFAGASGGLVASLVYTYVGDFVAEHKRGTATGIVMNAYAIASIVGIPLGLYLSNTFNWNSPFLYLSFLGILFWVIAIFKLPSLPITKKTTSPMEVYTSIFINPNAQRALLFMILLSVAGFAVIPFISTFVVANAGLPEQHLIYMYLISGVLNFFAGPLTGRLADRYGKFKIFSIMAILSAIPIVIFSTFNNAPEWMVLFITTLLFLFFAARYVPAMALITSSVPSHERGGFLTISNSIQQMTMGLSTFLGGLFIYTLPNGQLSGMLIDASISALAVLLSVLVARKIKIIS